MQSAAETNVRRRDRSPAHLAALLVGFAVVLSSSCQAPAKLLPVVGLKLVHQSAEARVRGLEIIAAAPESVEGKAQAREFLRNWQAEGHPAKSQFGTWQVTVGGDYAPDYFHSLRPAADFNVSGFTTRHVREGKGVALVGHRDNRSREAVEAHYPPEGICRPVTAVFRPGPGRTMHITLADPYKRHETAADFTAPLASLLSKAGPMTRMGLTGLLGGTISRERDHRLYLMEPYDPAKVPVIFVHGLLSTPLTWAEVTNEVWGDETFRRHHQVWHYLYPTSAPFLYSADRCRQQIDEVRRLVDPDGGDPASRHLDIVAHSMGGLLTRTLITDSGNAVWNQVFRVSPEQLKASEADRREVHDITHWKHRREVRRVIFIATPHRGSNMSRGFIGRIGDKLAGLPVNFTGLYARLNRDNPDALQPEFREALSRGKLTSIDTLSPDHPLLDTLLGLPVSPKVEIHSIIGNRGRSGLLEQSSDGVVPYTSSHLDKAQSERIVPTGHSAMKHPDSVAEILRILCRRSANPPRSR